MGLFGYDYIRTSKTCSGSDTTKSICSSCYRTIWYDGNALRRQDGYRCCHCNATILNLK